MGLKGPTEPHFQPVEWEVMNIFRFDNEGRLAEEWVQTDAATLQEQLEK
jgi:hypothetical protein